MDSCPYCWDSKAWVHWMVTLICVSILIFVGVIGPEEWEEGSLEGPTRLVCFVKRCVGEVHTKDCACIIANSLATFDRCFRRLPLLSAHVMMLYQFGSGELFYLRRVIRTKHVTSYSALVHAQHNCPPPLLKKALPS